MSNQEKSILVLDDDPDIGIMIRLMLEYKGHNVEITDRAEKAWNILHSKPIRLLIMDMLLSGSIGTDICKDLKQNPATSSIPIIMISAHPNARQICMAAGADDFVAKPFDMDDLLDRIDSIVKRA